MLLVYLDAGTTALALAQVIANRSDLTIISNDFEVITSLASQTSSELIHVGGQVRKKTFSCVGPLAAQTLASFSIDVAFISASSWDARGITTPDMDKVILKKAICQSSINHILISDSSKYGQVATFIALPLSELNTIITRYIRIIIGTQYQFNLQQITLYIFALLIFLQSMKFPSLSGMKELIK